MTLIGPDRPGLVGALSDRIAARGGNWLESRMARLGGRFAGVLLLDVPDDAAEALVDDLRSLESDGLRLTVERGGDGIGGSSPAPTHRQLRLELVGHDHPGIVREITKALADAGVNIEELVTEVATGSFSGERMFSADVLLDVPERTSDDALRAALETLANELMVDISLDAPTG